MEKYNKSKLEALNGFIRGINFGKISDKDVRSTFVRLIPQIARRTKEIEEDRKALFEKLIEPIPEDRRKAYDEANRERLEAMEKFRKSGDAEDRKDFEAKQASFVEEYKDVLDAVDELNKAIEEIMNEETELSVDHISVDKFLDGMDGQAFEINAKTFELLDPIVRFDENEEKSNS